MGYSDMNKKPFDPLTMIADAYETVKEYVNQKPELLEIANKTIEFLRGFYSDFGLELLSSIDYISNKEKTTDQQIISNKLKEWSNRKRSLFNNPKYLNISLTHLQLNGFYITLTGWLQSIPHSPKIFAKYSTD